MQQHGSGSGSPRGVRLHSLQEDEERREREVMNLKMEVAHLRERLHMRVGGETNAIELEDENFTLKRSLLETQRALVDHQDALREMDGKYAKAMLNLVKLDHAWKASAEDLKQAQQQALDAKAREFRFEQDLAAYKEDHERETNAAIAQAQRQEQQLAALMLENAQKEQQLARQSGEIEQFQLQIRELKGHMHALKTKSSGVQVASKQDYDELQSLYQEAKEQCATLRGETNALRDESTVLKKQIDEAKGAISSTTSRFLQLKEDYATSKVHLASAKQSVEEHKKEIAFLQSEIERIQQELSKRDDRLLQMEKENVRQSQQLAEQQKQIDNAEQIYGLRAERIVLAKENEWKEREEALERQLRDKQHEASRAQEQLKEMKQLELDVLLLLEGDAAANDANTHQDLRTRVKQELHRAKVTAVSLEKAKLRIESMERDLKGQAKLVQENSDLRAEYDKVKKVMERMAVRKGKMEGNRTPTKSTKRPSEERAELLRARGGGEPLRAKRKLESGQDEGEADSADGFRGISSISNRLNIERPAAAQAAATATTEASASSEEAMRGSKVKVKRVFVQSRYLNNVTSRRVDF